MRLKLLCVKANKVFKKGEIMRRSFFSNRSFKFILGGLVFLFVLITIKDVYTQPPLPTYPYTLSAHGNTTYGVNRKRTSIETGFGYSKGNCAHCHEQHASIGGQTITPKGYELFYDNYLSQTDGVCFKCHDNTTTYAYTAIVNRSYSYRAGGWTADTLNDIKEAFTNPPSLSSHNLTDIENLIDNNWNNWGYAADSNPCCACHNPHRAQGDPADSSLPKSSTTRGWPVSRPSQHSKDNNAWGLWGDNLPTSTERMSNYTANYQAPYRCGNSACTTTPSSFEPQGDTVSSDAAANTTDFVTFCIDCHNSTNTIYSTTLSRNLKTINWNTEKHGKGNADSYITVDSPYTAGSSSLGYVLSCMDCHEPHGTPNAFLIRKEVNGGMLGGSITTFSTTNWHYLCNRCHQDDDELNPSCDPNKYYNIHHSTTYGGDPYETGGGSCGSCHGGGGGGSGCTSDRSKKVCTDCHFHGSTHSGRITFQEPYCFGKGRGI